MRPTRSRSPRTKAASTVQNPSASASVAEGESVEEENEGSASGAGDSQSGAEGPVATQTETDFEQLTQRTPQVGTPSSYKYGRWVTLRLNPIGRSKNASFSIKLTGLLRHSM